MTTPTNPSGYPAATEIDGNLVVRDPSKTGIYGNITVDGTITGTKFIGPTALAGLQFLTGGGPLTLAMITAAQQAGYTGIFLDPRFVWNAAGLVLNGIQNFRIVSEMQGSIGWNGQVLYNTNGYISTGTAAADGIQIYASTPAGATATQGVVFENCVIVGSNPGFAVLHLGGGQRDCGLINTLVYNTSSVAGSYGVINDTALSNNNGENNIFMQARIAGAYAALGIGIADQTQHVNDTWYYDLRTNGGQYSIVRNNGGGHTFVGWYDRSNAAIASVWNHGGTRMTFIGGEHQNNTGLSHLIDSNAQVLLHDLTVTQAGVPTTCQLSSGSLIFRGHCGFNNAQTIAVSGTGTVDMSDPATDAHNVTVSGSAGTLLLAGNYAGQGQPPILTSWTGNTGLQGPSVVLANSGNLLTTTTTLSWTPPPVNTRFRVSLLIHPTVAGISTVPAISFTEYAGAVRNFTLPMWQGNGSATSPSYICAAVDSFYCTFEAMTDGSATPVIVTITPTSSTYRYSLAIERLS